jgi:hypothetical protein
MSRQEKLRRSIRRQYVRSIVQKALCIEKDIIKRFYTKTFGIESLEWLLQQIQ